LIVELPVARLMGKNGTETAIAPVQSRHRIERPLKILLVEDDADTANMLARMLKTRGNDVTIAVGCESALALAERHTFELVISDLGLPDGDGLQLMRQLKSQSQIRGIAYSGYGMEQDIRNSLLAGFSKHLTKPVSLDQIMSAIAEVTA
jgi:CheY-like chemotaxis protein